MLSFVLTLALCSFPLVLTSLQDATCETASNGVDGLAANAISLMQTSGKESCEWTTYYNVWFDTFKRGEYEPPNSFGGAHCLIACCQDPSCKGIALMSNEKYQCYEYKTLPAELSSYTGRPLDDGHWLSEQQPAWSVFVKAHGRHRDLDAGVLAMAIAKAEEAGGGMPVVSSPELIVKASLAPFVPLKPSGSGLAACEWTVHYNLWINTFRRGEYEPPNSFGGAHCLVACCQDPTCEGLALMSNEKYQCYEYKALPVALKSHRGTPLGDGKWLSQKTPAWSVFVKRSLPQHTTEVGSVPNTRSLAVNADVSNTSVSNMSLTRSIAVTLLASLVLAAVFCVASPGGVETLPSLAKRLAGLQGEPEARKLLEGIDLKDISDTSFRG